MSRSRCPRPQQKCDSIECLISDSQISFLLSPLSSQSFTNASNNCPLYSHPTLVTFPLDAPLKEILSDKHFINLAAKQESLEKTTSHGNTAHFEADGKILNENQSFPLSLLIKSLELVINNNIKLHFHKSKCIIPHSITIDQHQKGLFNRLPIENGHRPRSHEQLIYPNNGLDLLFDTLRGQLTYLTQYLKSHFGERHEFTIYPIQQEKQLLVSKQWYEWETGIYQMHGHNDGTIILALAADWGAGTMESALIASSMMNGLDLISHQQQRATADSPHYTIHLGDIYYVGLPEEIEHCCLGIKPPWADRGVRWPIGQNGSFTIPGNHELYSRGFGYWDYFLPHVGLFNSEDLTQPIHPQTTSYWLLENEQWRIIGLDTGYDSYSLLFIDNFHIKLPDELMDWLKTVVGLSPQMTDKRGLIFLSHHQVLSAWDEKPNTDFPEQIASLLPEGRTVLYLWGHEHRLSFYEKQTVGPIEDSSKQLTLYGRCIGNSGFPTLATELPVKARETKLLFYDDRLFSMQDGDTWNDIALGFNGYVTMKFVRPKQANDTSLYITYKSLSLNEQGQLTNENPTILVNEEWSVDAHGNVILSKLESVNKEMTRSVHVDMNNHQSTFTSNNSSCCAIL